MGQLVQIKGKDLDVWIDADLIELAVKTTHKDSEEDKEYDCIKVYKKDHNVLIVRADYEYDWGKKLEILSLQINLARSRT